LAANQTSENTRGDKGKKNFLKGNFLVPELSKEFQAPSWRTLARHPRGCLFPARWSLFLEILENLGKFSAKFQFWTFLENSLQNSGISKISGNSNKTQGGSEGHRRRDDQRFNQKGTRLSEQAISWQRGDVETLHLLGRFQTVFYVLQLWGTIANFYIKISAAKGGVLRVGWLDLIEICRKNTEKNS